MADLTRNNADLPIAIIGQTTAGVPTTPVGSDVNGNLLVKDYADGPVTPGTVAAVSNLAGGQFNTVPPAPTNGQQAALQIDYKGRLITAPATYSFFHPIYTTRVQVASNTNAANTTSLAVTINPTTAGNLIVVTAVAKAHTLTITDSASQAYTTATTIVSGTTNVYTFFKANTAAGVTSVTITPAATDALNIVVAEYANITTTPLDKTSSNTNSNVTSWTSNATTATTQANELLIGTATAISHNTTTFTPGTGWSSVGFIANGSAAANLVSFMEDQYVAATGTFAATGTTSASDTELAAIATFKITSYPSNFVIPNSPVIIKSGAGSLQRVCVNTAGTGSASVTFYDNTTNSGTVIATLSLTSQNSFTFGLTFTTGLTMVVNSNTADFTVIYD